MNQEFINAIISFSTAIIPWIILGSVIDYILGKVLKPETIKRWFTQGGVMKIFAIQYMGMLSPFTTMSFLPIAGNLVKRGANPALMLGFLAAERAYGIQSFFIIFALFGLKIALLHFALISLSLFVGMFLMRNATVSFREGKEDVSGDKAFLQRQARTYFFVLMGIIVAALLEVFLPLGIVELFTADVYRSVIGAVVLGFLLYLGTIFGNYPVAKSFLDVGMAPVGVLTFLVLSPLLNMVTILLFFSVVRYKEVLRFVALYSIAGLILALLAGAIFL